MDTAAITARTRLATLFKLASTSSHWLHQLMVREARELVQDGCPAMARCKLMAVVRDEAFAFGGVSK